MYNSEFWDDLYEDRSEAAPWLGDDWANFNIEHISKYIGDPKGKNLLDYGCGNASIGDYFYQKGANLSLADISAYQVEKLKKKYGTTVLIDRVDFPSDIKQKNFYDYILCMGVFHHINPDLWGQFFSGLYDLLKKDGVLIVSGWDINDPVLIKENYKGCITYKDCWAINDIASVIEGAFEKKASFVDYVDMKAFNMKRLCRFFVFNKMENREPVVVEE